MSRFVLVVLREDLAERPFPTTRGAVFASLHHVNGVESVTDLEVLSPHTLEEWMLPRDQSLVPVRQKRTGVQKDRTGHVNNK